MGADLNVQWQMYTEIKKDKMKKDEILKIPLDKLAVKK